MKIQLHSAFAVAILVLQAGATPALAQSTAFTYQGRLQHGGNPANGLYEMSFALYDAVTSGSAVGVPVTVSPVPVTNGLFTVTLNFGAAPFMGADRWLEIAVTVFGSDQPVVTLIPRQPLTPVPYALHAYNAAGLMSFTNAPLDIKVNGARALRLELTGEVPNLIGGLSENSVEAGLYGVTISGGGRMGIPQRVSGSGFWGTIGGGAGNIVEAYGATVSGGVQNHIHANSDTAVIGGGQGNAIGSGEFEYAGDSFIGGGTQNRIQSGRGVIAGGAANTIGPMSNESGATIGGGQVNTIEQDAYGATITGGWNHTIRSNSMFSFIGGGDGNFIESESFHSTISGGASNSMANKVERSTIGGGANNTIGYFANATTIAGGMNNAIDGVTGGSTISGGWFNHINEEASLVTIAGGGNNLVSDNAGGAVISGGENNQVYASYGIVGGGHGNVILFASPFAVIAGGRNNFVANHYGTVAGGENNEVRALYAVIGGGQDNIIQAEADGSVIAGGSNNRIGTNAVSNFIGGGGGNRIDAASSSAIVSGFDNHLGSYASVISGGRENGILENAEFSAIAGGENNHIADGSRNSAIGGGGNNQILVNSSHAMIPGGLENVATNLAFAAGKFAYAVHSGAFVWADASDVRYYSVSTNEFAVRATGGVRFATAVDATGAPTAGVALAPGSGTWSSLSDRNAKENFTTAIAREILDKVAALPLGSWNYKAQGAGVRHLGPMAQDFRAAFGLGENDTTIGTVDADGVALAAIQGLNQKVDEKDAEIRNLRARLERLEQLLSRELDSTERK